MKRLTTFLLLLIGISWYGCNSEVPNLSSDEVFAIRTVDIGNNQNASDLIVSFKVNNPSTIKELRAFLINPADFPDFTSTKAEELLRSSYHTITTIDADNQVVLPATLNAVDGTSIEKDVDYFIGFAVLVGDDVLLNSQIGEAKITDDHFLTGRFTGTWDDNLYSGFGISAELTLAGSFLSGPFWYSNNFTSCCGGQNDGTISLRLEDTKISSFTYNQQLVSFMGGACNGTYTGEGQIENFTDLVISFEGDDCEGPHTNGRIVLRKEQ